MIEVFSEPGAAGWYAEVWLRVGFQKRLIHRTADHYQEADKAEEVACEWALGAMTQFFEFYVAQSAEQVEEPVEDTENVDKSTGAQSAEQVEEPVEDTENVDKSTGRQKAAAR